MRKPFQYSSLFFVAALAQAAAATPASYVIGSNTPRFVAAAQKGADAKTSDVIEVTLWLTPHNRAALDTRVASAYDRSSPLYHQWLSRDALGKMIAPSDAEAAEVAKFLKASNLTIVAQDKFNLSVRARGTVGDVQKAFNVKLANVTFKGDTFRTNLADPTIADPAGAHVMAITGLDNVGFVHHNIAQSAAVKGMNLPTAKAAASPDALGGDGNCFPGTGSETFTTSGSNPSATYTGNLYTKSGTGCGYTPTQIQAAYGLTSLYSQGYDGTGQTIVIIDWCGSPTITGDANAFSKKYGLPALTSANFAIINYPGQSSCSAEDPEINIDVEWSHAIAPGANIVLLVPPTPTFQDIDSALVYLVENDLGSVVSNSYGSEEIYTDTTTLTLQNFIIEAAAGVGIAVNYSTGDDGDFTFDFPQYDPPSVSAPADSPYATGIGGISLGLTKTKAIQFQAAWGTNETLLAEDGFTPVPAENFGFDFGSGGGSSVFFAKPSYQSSLKGKFRKLPDISWLADPFTGGIIAISVPFQSPAISYTVYGGTSLACPMFSALWAIADQVAGASLGQAAPMLYGAPSSAITDVVTVGSDTNVTASYTRANGSTFNGSANSLAVPLEGTHTYMSAIWNYPALAIPGTALLLTFGTDSGLKAAPGWDNATGLGVASPAGLVSYISAMAASAKH